MGTMIKGSVEEINRSGKQLQDFSSQLDTTLKNVKSIVDEIASSTYGSASNTLLDVYYSLNTDLEKYVQELDTLGTNVQTSASNLETIDTDATANLSYEG